LNADGDSLVRGSCQRTDNSMAVETDNNTNPILMDGPSSTNYTIPDNATVLYNINVLAVQNETFNIASWKLIAIVQNNGVHTTIVKVKDNYAGTNYNADDQISPNVHDEFFGDVKISFYGVSFSNAWNITLHNTTGDAQSIRIHADLHGTEILSLPQPEGS
jgi:hypothetical protein